MGRGLLFHVPPHRRTGDALHLDDAGRADVGGRYDMEAREVERLAACQGDRGLLDAEEVVRYHRVRLLNLVEEEDASPGRPEPLDQGPEDAARARPRTEKQGNPLLRRELRSVYPRDGLRPEEVAARLRDRLRLSRSGRAEYQQKAPRPAAGRMAHFPGKERV